MNDTRNTTDVVEQRLRHDLSVVAGTVTGAPLTRRASRHDRARKRRLVAWAAGLAVAVPVVTAATVLNSGPEYVDTIPPDTIVMEGSVDGSDYLLVESRRTDQCGDPVTGVELVEENKNLLGSEWNTIGFEYGEMVDTRCGYVNDTTRYLGNPALFNDSGVKVSDSFVWVYAVHPDVTEVRITSGAYTKDLTVHAVDGAGYALFEIPGNLTEYTSVLVIDDQVVPGSAEVQQVPQPE